MFPVEAPVVLRHRPSCQAVTSNGNSKERLFVDRFGSRRAVCLSSRRNEADEQIGRVQTNMDLVAIDQAVDTTTPAADYWDMMGAKTR